MKKIILSVVFVFASLTMVNANSKIEPVNDTKVGDKVEVIRDCENETLIAGEIADRRGYSMEEIFVVMNVHYATCMGYSYEEIEAAGNL
ncbi:MAG: hypothetical protein ACOH1N_05120 [Lutibacter sp.]